jgi:uncharacterized protein
VAPVGVTSVVNISLAMAQDMSNGANNFYTSDKVSVQKITFKNQYQRIVAGNLYILNDLDLLLKFYAAFGNHICVARKLRPTVTFSLTMRAVAFVTRYR